MNNPLFDDAQTLDAAGVKDGDLLSVREARPGAPAGPQPQRRQGAGQQQQGRELGRDEADALRQEALRNPQVAAGLRRYQPELAEALQDPALFRRKWVELRQAADSPEERRRRQLVELETEDAGTDPEKQREIEELIREREVEANLQHALEWLPECTASPLKPVTYFTAFLV